MISTQAKIVRAASSLFYREGVRSVSVDAIAAKAGITKRSLYYHFKSKDALIEAYLEVRDQPNLDTFERWFNAADGDVATKVRAIFTNLADSARSPRWKGCGFLRSAAELVMMPGHPALKAANLHKSRLENWLAAVLDASSVSNAEVLSRQLRLLLDGGFTVVLLNRDPGYMEIAGEAAEALVRAQLSPGRP